MPMPARGALALLALVTAGSAHAQFVQPPPRNFFFVMSAGLSTGGDTLAEAEIVTLPPYGGSYTSSQSVRAGALVQFNAGLMWRPTGVPLAMQATVGYQVDSINADNGDITWTRVPFELLAFYTGLPRWRFGGGARFVRSAELDFDVGRSDNFRFKDTNGVVLEAGYEIAPRFWINARYVDEDYEIESVNGYAVAPAGKLSGRAGGINVLYAF